MTESEQLRIDIGKRLKKSRKEFGLTQEEMAEKLDVTIKHYGCVERGTTGLSISNTMKACKILGITMDYLCFGIENSDSVPYIFIEKYNKIDINKREYLLKYMDILDSDKWN